MSYYSGGDLNNMLNHAKQGRLPESLAKIYSAEILLALEELHKNGILYRDLKPENVVIGDKGHAHLTDFGLAKLGEFTNTGGGHSFCGSIAYLAPEMIKKAGHGKAMD